MKNLVYSLLLALTLASPALAQVFACQNTDTTGFQYGGGRWSEARFVNPAPFFLELRGGRLTTESAAKVLNSRASDVRCEANGAGMRDVFHTCSHFSSQVVFAPQIGGGSVARMYGATMGGDRRDSVAVSLFTCQSM